LGLLHRLTKAIDKAGGINLALSIFASQRSEDCQVAPRLTRWMNTPCVKSCSLW
jgi:hypothetical protein